MRAFALLTVLLLVPCVAGAQDMPCFFMDFDEDGEADYDHYITCVDLGFFEPATLYIPGLITAFLRVQMVWPRLSTRFSTLVWLCRAQQPTPSQAHRLGPLPSVRWSTVVAGSRVVLAVMHVRESSLPR